MRPVGATASLAARPSRLRAAFGLCALLAARAASAQPIADRDAEARRLFEEGVALLDRNAPREALSRLTASRAIREVPAVVYNIVAAQRMLGHYRDVVSGLAAYRRLAGDRLNEARLAEVEALESEALSHLVVVHLHVTAPAARVEIDGAEIPAGRVAESIYLDPGRHVFHAFGASLQAVDEVRTAVAGDSLDVTLSPRLDASTPPGPRIDHSPGRLNVAPALRPSSSSSVFSRWWFWTAVGVVAAASVTVLAVSLSATEAAPNGGSLGLVVQGVESR